MDEYRVVISFIRNKIPIIKLLRALAGREQPLGLKEAKDRVEAAISFADYNTDNVHLNLRLNDESLGRLYYHAFWDDDQQHPVSLVSIERISPRDFTFDLVADL